MTQGWEIKERSTTWSTRSSTQGVRRVPTTVIDLSGSEPGSCAWEGDPSRFA